MKKKLSPSHKGFILFETLLAFAVVTFAVIFFYKGSVTFLIASEEQQKELQMYRVLYEEVSEARRNGKQTGRYPITRGGTFQLDYQLEQECYAAITEERQSLRVYRKE